MAVDQLEVVLDGVLARSSVGTEPDLVSVRTARDTLKVRVGLAGVGLCAISGDVKLQLSDRRAEDERSPLVVGAGDGEFTRELELGNILNGGVEVLGCTVSIDVGEQVRWLDGVASMPGFSEVVSSGD